jgi:hypothetical protein
MLSTKSILAYRATHRKRPACHFEQRIGNRSIVMMTVSHFWIGNTARPVRRDAL